MECLRGQKRVSCAYRVKAVWSVYLSASAMMHFNWGAIQVWSLLPFRATELRTMIWVNDDVVDDDVAVVDASLPSWSQPTTPSQNIAIYKWHGWTAPSPDRLARRSVRRVHWCVNKLDGEMDGALEHKSPPTWHGRRRLILKCQTDELVASVRGHAHLTAAGQSS